MRMWIDCEWNSDGGELISMALVAEDGVEFYEEIKFRQPPHPWVRENVMPHLSRAPLSYTAFQIKLGVFLSRYADSDLTVIADWPEDLERFCRALVLGGGKSTLLFPIQLSCRIGKFSAARSEVPHHALWDARANRDCQLAEEGHDG